MSMKEKTKLKMADINKVDFVNAGAQQDSKISIFKSADKVKGQKISLMAIIEKALSDFLISPKEDDKIDEVAKSDEVDEVCEEVEKTDEIENEEEVEKMEKEKVLEGAEDIFKGMPEEVVKIFQEQNMKLKAAEEKILKMKDENDSKEYIAKAVSLTSNLGIDANELGNVLKSINSFDSDLSIKIENIIKTANDIVSKSALMKEVGSDVSGKTVSSKKEAWNKIEKKAEELVSKGITLENAISKVLETEEGQKLYNEYLK